jgi:poly(beta-D-mannuronate) lyase
MAPTGTRRWSFARVASLCTPRRPAGFAFTAHSTCLLTGSRNVFRGFQFTSGGIGDDTVIDVTGSENTLTQLKLDGYRARRYVQFASEIRSNEMTYSDIARKSAEPAGPAVQINTSPTVVGYHRNRYCAFRDFPGPGGEHGNEPIRIGLGEERSNASRTAFEHCYFARLGTGNSESISVKSSENVCRHNTFTDNPGGMLVFRAGNGIVAYANFFLAGSSSLLSNH